MTTADFAPGGYRYIPAVFQYSGGVAAAPGFAIERVRFAQPVPLAEGFRGVETFIRATGRPLTAFCASELRAPAPFDAQGFRAFNESYIVTLQNWGLYADGRNAVARSNVCPEIDPPAEPCFHAFSFTVAAAGARPSFVIAGSGEAREGAGSYAERTVRHGDRSAEGLREKARHVLDEMERRLGLFGFGWADTRRRRSIPSMTCSRSSPTRSSAAAPRMRASPGISTARRCWTSTTRWTAAALPPNA
jgi:hypothetical protein